MNTKKPLKLVFYYNKNKVHNILKYKKRKSKNHTKSTKCQYSIIQVKKTIFIWETCWLTNLIVPKKSKKTPKDTWLKWSKSMPNKILQKELVLEVNVRRENSHNWFQINKKPKSRLKKQRIILKCKLLQFKNM